MANRNKATGSWLGLPEADDPMDAQTGAIRLLAQGLAVLLVCTQFVCLGLFYVLGQEPLVWVHLGSGTVEFLDRKGQPIVRETEEGRTLTPVKIQGEDTFHVRQQWDANADEALFGMGEHHLGLMNIKGYDLDLWQHNGTHALPFLVSSRGYGIFWDNTSYTRFGDPRPFEHIPADRLFGADGKPGGLTVTFYSGLDLKQQLYSRVDPKVDFRRPPGATPDPAVPPTTRP